MRKIINSTYISLDGVVESPHLWPRIERPGDEVSAAATKGKPTTIGPRSGSVAAGDPAWAGASAAA